MNVVASIEPTLLRKAMGRFATGVAVITTLDTDGTPHGMTVNSLTSVSLDPPLILVCFMHGARTADAAVRAGRFAASILAARQEPIARRFASRGSDHFDGLSLDFEQHEVPVVPHALAHIECAVDHVFNAGDHVVVVGKVERVCHQEGSPLALLDGRFGDYTDRGHEQLPWFF